MNEYIEYNKNSKLYTCTKCKKNFSTSSNLKKHLERKKSCILKTEYKCTKCLKIFSNLYNYKLHINRKTNCLEDINAPYKKKETNINNNEELENKIKELRLEIEEKNEKISKLYEDNNKCINDCIENLLSDYTDIIVFKREPKILSLLTYLKDFLLKKEELNLHKIKTIIHYVFNKIKIENVNQVISIILNMEDTNKKIIIDIIKEYIIILQKSNNETVYGKLRTNYIEILKERFSFQEII